jgi:hypothetical protein
LSVFIWGYCSPTIPVPDIIKNGVKDSDVKAFADQATVYINKGLGAPLPWSWVGFQNFLCCACRSIQPLFLGHAGFLFRLLSGKDIILVGKVMTSFPN